MVASPTFLSLTEYNYDNGEVENIKTNYFPLFGRKVAIS